MSLLPRIIPMSSLKMKILMDLWYHLMLWRPTHCDDFRMQGSKISVPSSAYFSLLNHGLPLSETSCDSWFVSSDSCEIEFVIEISYRLYLTKRNWIVLLIFGTCNRAREFTQFYFCTSVHCKWRFYVWWKITMSYYSNILYYSLHINAIYLYLISNACYCWKSC